MQAAALEELGLAPEWTYEAIEVAPEDFAGLVASLPDQGFAGVNVTVPHKLAALAAADQASEAATAIGAANTLSFHDGTVEADNTDAVGIVSALPDSPAGKRALVMGAGGSARAAVWALREAGTEVTVWNRTTARAEALARQFGLQTADRRPQTADFDVVLNATTVGLEAATATGPSGGQPSGTSGSATLKGLPFTADSLRAGQTVVDLVYGTSETELITAARAAGSRTVDGLEILVRQGAASLRLWTGKEPPLDAMRRAARGV